MSDAPPTVAIVGDGPSVDAVEAALRDVTASVQHAAIEEIADADRAVVIGVSGSGGFARANREAVAAGVPWIAVEIGGIGGHETGTATVGAFTAEGPCYRCLGTRMQATDAAGGEDPGTVSRSDARFAGAIAGRLTVEALAGAAVEGAVVEAPETRRTLLAVPTCRVCGADARDHSFTAAHRDVPVTEAAEHAERAVDERVGIVPLVGERESYPAPYYFAQLADTENFSDASPVDNAAGVSPDWDAAYVKALGEALERYSAAVYRTDAFRAATVTELTDPVRPSAFVRPEGARTVDDDEQLAWLPATNLTDDTDTSVPAAFVVFPPPTEDLAPAITTGLGLGSSSVAAALSGVYEVIERDATMLSWYSTYDPVGITVDDDAFEALRRRAASEDLTTQTVLVTQDVDVPVVAAAVHRDAWPRFATGSAADLDADAAARDALAEAVQNWMELRALGREDATDAGRGVARYARNPSEVGGYFDSETTIPAGDVGPDPVPTGEAELEAVVDRLSDAGLKPTVTRLTTRDVASLGFEVVRVLVPAAQPLFVDDPFFGERARTVPRDLGYRPRLDRGYHPFP